MLGAERQQCAVATVAIGSMRKTPAGTAITEHISCLSLQVRCEVHSQAREPEDRAATGQATVPHFLRCASGYSPIPHRHRHAAERPRQALDLHRHLLVCLHAIVHCGAHHQCFLPSPDTPAESNLGDTRNHIHSF